MADEDPPPVAPRDASAADPAPVPAFRLFGTLTALGPGTGEPVDLGSPKQRAVLAVLLLHRGRVVSSDRLIDAVWAEQAPPAAMASLQAYVSNLRRVLRDPRGGPSPIARRAPGYVLEVPADRLDLTAVLEADRSARSALGEQRWADALEAADLALGLARGPLLEDLSDEPWVQVEAARVAETLAAAGESRATALLAEGRVSEAILQTRALRDAHPLRDRGCWLQMVALHRAGRSPEALEAYREHAARLDEELGLESGPELRDLQVAILRHDPALAAWPRSPGWGGARSPAGPAAAEPIVLDVGPEEPEVLVGRGREVTELDRLRVGVEAGQTAWLTLTGPAGIGKTRLAEEHGRRVRTAGGREVWARCSDETGAPAWWPVRQLVRALGADADDVLVPAPGIDADAARFAVYERVAALVAATAATAPLLLVVDDVQWADSTSARCLAFLVGALQGHRVAFVLTLRDGEDDAAVRPLLTALARSGGHRQLAVAPLAPADVRELADRVADAPLDAAEASALAARTGGNPLFVREYARLDPRERAGGGVPLAVRSVLGRRLVGLRPDVLRVLQVAAVLDDVQDLELLGAVADLGPDAVADLLDDAADERIVVTAPGTGGYAFAHGLLRDEVVEGIPTLRRPRLHLRAAAALEARNAAPSRRAQHLLRALPLADPAELLDACRRAAVDATERYSAETAAEWWAQALRAFDLLPDVARTGRARDDLLVARVEALARAGRGQSLLDVVDGGLLDAVREGRTSAAGRLAASLLRASGAWPWVSSGDPGPLRERLEAVEPLLDDDPAALARVLAASAVGNAYHPDPLVADGQTRRAMALAEELGDPEVLADVLLGRIITYSGIPTHCEECLDLVSRLQALRHEHRRVDGAVGHSVASMATMMQGDVAAAAEHVRRGIATAELLRLPVVRVQLRWMQALLAHWHGDLIEARRQIAVAAEVHQQTELHSAASIGLVGRLLDREEGRPSDDPRPSEIEPVAWDAVMAAARGDVESADAAIATWIAGPGPLVWTTLSHAVLLADVTVDLGLRARAAGLVEILEPHAHRVAIVGQVAVAGIVALALARLHHLLGEDGRAGARLDEARALADRGGGRIARLRCLLLEERMGPQDPGGPARLRRIAEEAEALGFGGLAADARGLAT